MDFKGEDYGTKQDVGKLSSSKSRQIHRDKKMSVKNKKIKQERKKWDNKDQILETHNPYNWDSTKSLHILINQWYHRLRDNCVVLKIPRESGSSNERKIFYDVDLIGKNINYNTNKNNMILNIERTKQNWIIILVKFKDVMYNSKLCFFSETDVLIDENNLWSNNEG